MGGQNEMNKYVQHQKIKVCSRYFRKINCQTQAGMFKDMTALEKSRYRALEKRNQY